MINKINILLVDDHAVVRAGYKTYLSLSHHIGEIYEAERGEVACQLFDLHKPDVVLLDLSMPGIGGFETIKRLINRDSNCKVLVFSAHSEPLYATRAIKAGAKGYVTKNCMSEELVNAVYKVYQGSTYVSSELAQHIIATMSSIKGDDIDGKIHLLSPREFDVFSLLANGYTTKQISQQLHLAYKTVCNHGTNIREKLGVTSVAELTLLAMREGIIKFEKANT
ncbi:MAG: response regulator transcription factor [Methylococcales bacterium]|nr:response regulator transcription factor [Methylococcales bacterium]